MYYYIFKKERAIKKLSHQQSDGQFYFWEDRHKKNISLGILQCEATKCIEQKPKLCFGPQFRSFEGLTANWSPVKMPSHMRFNTVAEEALMIGPCWLRTLNLMHLLLPEVLFVAAGLAWGFQNLKQVLLATNATSGNTMTQITEAFHA